MVRRPGRIGHFSHRPRETPARIAAAGDRRGIGGKRPDAAGASGPHATWPNIATCCCAWGHDLCMVARPAMKRVTDPATPSRSGLPPSAAEIVAQADRLGRPVIQVFSQPPYHVAYHRVALSPRSEAPGGFQVYIPHPIDTSESLLPESLTELTERLAESTHDNWAQRRLAEGWNWGPARDDEAKTAPGPGAVRTTARRGEGLRPSHGHRNPQGHHGLGIPHRPCGIEEECPRRSS